MSMNNDNLLIPLVRDTQFNWKTFKQDTKALVDSTRAFKRNKLTNREFHSNLFGPMGLSFKDGSSFAIVASTKMFDTKKEMSAWLKLNRPLVYLITLHKENTPYLVRYFEDVGKLPIWKYHLQWFLGRYNFKFIRPFLYRMFVLNF